METQTESRRQLHKKITSGIELRRFPRARNRKQRNRSWAWAEPSPITLEGCLLHLHIYLYFWTCFASMSSCKCLFGFSAGVMLIISYCVSIGWLVRSSCHTVRWSSQISVQILIAELSLLSSLWATLPRFSHYGYVSSWMAENRTLCCRPEESKREKKNASMHFINMYVCTSVGKYWV